MCMYATVVAGQKVIDSTVLAVSYNRFSRYARCDFMLFHQRNHQMRFVDITCRGFCRSDYLTSFINSPVHLIGKLRLPTVDYGCIRISAGNVTIVFLLICPGRIRAFAFIFQAIFQLFVVFVQLVFEIPWVDDGIVRGICVYKAGINENLSAINQAGFHALYDNTLKKALENLYSPFLPVFDFIVSESKVYKLFDTP